MVEIVLFRDLLKEMRSHIDFLLISRMTEKVAQTKLSEDMTDLMQTVRTNLDPSVESKGSKYDDPEDHIIIRRILKRFRLINPALLYSTIRKCEAHGLIQSS